MANHPFLTLSATLLAVALSACQPSGTAVDSTAGSAAQAGHDAHAEASAADASPEEHAHHADAALAPFPAQPWASDAPLRAGMSGIAEAHAQARSAGASGELSPADAKALAATVDERVAYMFANCELPEDADTALHVLLARISEAAHQAPVDAEGALQRMEETLALYPRYFEHPDWPVAAAH